MSEDSILLEEHPSWWNFFWYFVFFWLIIPLFIGLWKKRAQLLRIYDNRVLLEVGVLSKSYTEVFIKDIRTINIKQSLIQRLVNIGDVKIGTAGIEGYELSAYGLPCPGRIKDLIMTQRGKYS